MKLSNSSYQSIVKVVCIIIAVGLSIGLVSSCTTAVVQHETEGPTPEPGVWRESIAQVPLPKEGCFQSTYPSMEWDEVECSTAPNYPYIPKEPPKPLIVGNGNDLSPEVPSGLGFISSATGTFEDVTNVTSESGQNNGTGPAVANAYSIQLNTNFFTSTACSGAAVPATCQGWEQFIFANNGSSGWVFIQYWLLLYNTTCPAGWNQFSFPSSTDIYCYRNSTSNTAVPNQPITNLANLSLTGTVNSSGDSVKLVVGSTAYTASGNDYVNVAAGWTIADFAIVGNAGGGQANFNSGASFTERTRISYGHGDAPNCVAQGFTGETNNLNFGPTVVPTSQPGPALLDQQSSSGYPLAQCSLATTVGDTHLTTFGGLLYDFQASGDFLVAQVGPDFVVQARQVSGAPTWPNASVNSAIATRMGKTQVAICLGETPLHIDGKPTTLADGEALSLPDGIDIWRVGDVYIIIGPDGNSVRAKVNAAWINVSVGLGRWPVEVRGLLANANEGVTSIAASDGTVLTAPFPFDEIYGHYGESWRVPEDESMLYVCGEKVERDNPTEPFYAQNLDEEVYARNQAICFEAGVQEGPLLDACILDVAVIGDKEAANVFAEARPPVAVGIIVGKDR
jgi:hypothetical protein